MSRARSRRASPLAQAAACSARSPPSIPTTTAASPSLPISKSPRRDTLRILEPLPGNAQRPTAGFPAGRPTDRRSAIRMRGHVPRCITRCLHSAQPRLTASACCLASACCVALGLLSRLRRPPHWPAPRDDVLRHALVRWLAFAALPRVGLLLALADSPRVGLPARVHCFATRSFATRIGLASHALAWLPRV